MAVTPARRRVTGKRAVAFFQQRQQYPEEDSSQVAAIPGELRPDTEPSGDAEVFKESASGVDAPEGASDEEMEESSLCLRSAGKRRKLCRAESDDAGSEVAKAPVQASDAARTQSLGGFEDRALESGGCVMSEDEPWTQRSLRATGALFVAAARGDGIGVCRALAKGARHYVTALESCVCGLPEELCVCLGYTPLHCAAQAGNCDAVQALLLAACDVRAPSGRLLFNAQDDNDALLAADALEPLHVAAACGHAEVVALLLVHRADPHAAAIEPNRTAIGFAAYAGHRTVAEQLREAGAARAREVARKTADRDALGGIGVDVPSSALQGMEGFLASQGQGLTGGIVAVDTPRIESLRLRVRARLASNVNKDESAPSVDVNVEGRESNACAMEEVE